MSFEFRWPSFTEDELGQMRERLVSALNGGPQMPSNIVDHIDVEDLNMGSKPPDLEILEVGELSKHKFRGIFKLHYEGDAYVVLRTKVQVNPVVNPVPLHISGTSDILAASSPLHVPMRLRISQLRLNGIVVLVVDRRNGVTLAFKNDPLDRVIVSSSFDHVPNIKRYLQEQIEARLRRVFLEEVPDMVHRISLGYLNEARESEFEAYMEQREREREKRLNEEEVHWGIWSLLKGRKQKVEESGWSSANIEESETESSADGETPIERLRRRGWKGNTARDVNTITLSEEELDNIAQSFMQAATNVTDFLPESENNSSKDDVAPAMQRLWEAVWRFLTKHRTKNPVEVAQRQGLKMVLENGVREEMGFRRLKPPISPRPGITSFSLGTGESLSDDEQRANELVASPASPVTSAINRSRLRASPGSNEANGLRLESPGSPGSLALGASAMSPKLHCQYPAHQHNVTFPLAATSFCMPRSLLQVGSTGFPVPSPSFISFAGIPQSMMNTHSVTSRSTTTTTTAQFSRPRPHIYRRHEIRRCGLAWDTRSAPVKHTAFERSARRGDGLPVSGVSGRSVISSASAGSPKHPPGVSLLCGQLPPLHPGMTSRSSAEAESSSSTSFAGSARDATPGCRRKEGLPHQLQLVDDAILRRASLPPTSPSRGKPSRNTGTQLLPSQNAFGAHLHTLAFANQTMSPVDVGMVRNAVPRAKVPLRRKAARVLDSSSTSMPNHLHASGPVADGNEKTLGLPRNPMGGMALVDREHTPEDLSPPLLSASCTSTPSRPRSTTALASSSPSTPSQSRKPYPSDRRSPLSPSHQPLERAWSASSAPSSTLSSLKASEGRKAKSRSLCLEPLTKSADAGDSNVFVLGS